MGISEAFKKLDIFGEPVKINFQGESSYNTACGSIVSIFLAIAMIGISVMGFLDLKNYEDLNIIQYDIYEKQNDDVEVNFGENGGGFLFGILNI